MTKNEKNSLILNRVTLHAKKTFNLIFVFCMNLKETFFEEFEVFLIMRK